MIDHSTQITPWLSLSFWNQAFLHQFLSIVQCIGIVSAKEYLIGEAYKIFKILNKVYCVVFQGKKWGNATLLCPEHVGLQNDRFQSIAPAHPTLPHLLDTCSATPLPWNDFQHVLNLHRFEGNCVWKFLLSLMLPISPADV